MWASNNNNLSTFTTSTTASEITEYGSNFSDNGVTTMKYLAGQQLLASYDDYGKYCENLQGIGQMYNKIHGIASITVCVFGIVANILNFLILTRKEMVNSTNAILTGLAVSDLLNLVEYVPYAIYTDFLPDLVNGGTRKTYPWAVFVLIHSNFSQVCHTISIWLTVTIAAWRYFMISTPLQSRVLCSMERAKMMIVMAYCITPILCLPIYFTFSVQAIMLNRTNSVISIKSLYSPQDFSSFYYNFTQSFTTLPSVAAVAAEGNNIKYVVNLSNLSIRYPNFVKVNFWIYSVVLKIIPCILLTVVSFCLINSLLKAKKRKEMLLGPTPSSIEAAAVAASSSTKSRKLPTTSSYPFSHIPNPSAVAAVASTTIPPSSPPPTCVFTVEADGDDDNNGDDSSHNISRKNSNTCCKEIAAVASADSEIPLQELGVPTQEQYNIIPSSFKQDSSTLQQHSLAVQVTPDIESEQTSISQYAITTSTSTNRISSSSVSTGDIYLTSRTTRMLLTVLILFLITEFPQGILALFSAIMGQEFFKRCYLPMANLMDFLALVNCSINFICYSFLSRRFRDALFRMLKRRK